MFSSFSLNGNSFKNIFFLLINHKKKPFSFHRNTTNDIKQEAIIGNVCQMFSENSSTTFLQQLNPLTYKE